MSTITEKLKWLIEADATSAIRGFEQTAVAAETSLGKAEGKTKNLGGTLTKVGAGATAFAAIAGAALFEVAKKFEETALKAGEFSDATGINVEDASRLIAVAKDVGVGADTLESSIGKMNKTLGNSPEKFDNLGVHIASTKAGTEDVNGTFLNVIDRLNAIEDPAARAAAAASIFGKGWQGAAELLHMSTDDIKTRLQSVSEARVINEEELQKAKDFRDDINNLKHSFSDLAMEIGSGAMPVLGGLIGVAGDAAAGFSHLDKMTSGAAGSFLAAGTIGIGTIGVMTLIGGQLVKLGTAFTNMGGLAKAGMGVAALALVAYTLDAQDTARANANLKTSIEDLSKVSDADLMKTFIGTLVKGYFAEKDLKQTTDELAQSNLEGALRVRDMVEAHIANGTATQNEKDAIDPLIQSIKDKQAADIQGKETTDKYKSSTEDATAATDAAALADKLAKGAIDALKAAHDEAARKVDVFTKSLQDEQAQIDTLYPKEYNAVTAKYDFVAAQRQALLDTDALTTTLKDHKATTDDVNAAVLTATGSIITAAEKFATMDGAALGSEGANRRLIASLQDQEAALAPDSPLRAYLDSYIADLKGIPEKVATTLALHVSSDATNVGAAGYSPLSGGARAAGGPVAAGASYLVGEQGPEVVTMAGNGSVTPNGALGGVHIGEVHLHVQNMPTPNELVVLLAKYTKWNGPGALKALTG